MEFKSIKRASTTIFFLCQTKFRYFPWFPFPSCTCHLQPCGPVKILNSFSFSHVCRYRGSDAWGSYLRRSRGEARCPLPRHLWPVPLEHSHLSSGNKPRIPFTQSKVKSDQTVSFCQPDGSKRGGLLRRRPRWLPVREGCVGECGYGGRSVHAQRAGRQDGRRPGQGDGRRRVHLQAPGTPVWVQGSDRSEQSYRERLQTLTIYHDPLLQIIAVKLAHAW